MSKPDEADKPTLEQVLDVFVYAPIGLALEAREQLPKYIERGRGQVAIARVMGRFAASKAEQEAGKIVSAAVESFADGFNGTAPAGPDAATDDPLVEPLEDYATLSAANIVKLAPSLSEEQLRAIRTYEEANRNRVTVLNRVKQLLDAQSS